MLWWFLLLFLSDLIVRWICYSTYCNSARMYYNVTSFYSVSYITRKGACGGRLLYIPLRIQYFANSRHTSFYIIVEKNPSIISLPFNMKLATVALGFAVLPNQASAHCRFSSLCPSLNKNLTFTDILSIWTLTRNINTSGRTPTIIPPSQVNLIYPKQRSSDLLIRSYLSRSSLQCGRKQWDRDSHRLVGRGLPCDIHGRCCSLSSRPVSLWDKFLQVLTNNYAK